MKKCFRIMSAVLAFVFGGFIFFANTYAADDGNFSTSMFVSPMLQKIVLTPGETYRGSISVSNGNQARDDLRFTVKVGSLGWEKNEESKDDYGAVDVETRSGRNVMMDWIEVDTTSGVVSPNETEKINYTITVPKDAPAGAQYASILVARDDDEEEGSSEGISIKNKYQLVSSIIANVWGETKEVGEILDNSFPTFLLNGEFEATAMVENKGNVYTDVEYKLQVWPLFSGEEIYSNEEKPEAEMILPETKKYHSQKVNLPGVGIYKVKQTVKIFGEESVMEGTVIYCPIWLMLVIIFGFAMIVLWLVMMARGRKKAAGRKSAEE